MFISQRSLVFLLCNSALSSAFMGGQSYRAQRNPGGIFGTSSPTFLASSSQKRGSAEMGMAGADESGAGSSASEDMNDTNSNDSGGAMEQEAMFNAIYDFLATGEGAENFAATASQNSAIFENQLDDYKTLYETQLEEYKNLYATQIKDYEKSIETLQEELNDKNAELEEMRLDKEVVDQQLGQRQHKERQLNEYYPLFCEQMAAKNKELEELKEKIKEMENNLKLSDGISSDSKAKPSKKEKNGWFGSKKENELQKELKDLSEEVAAKNSKLQELNDQVTQMKAELEESTASCTKFESDLSQSAETSAAKDAEMNELKMQMKEMEATVKSSLEDADAARKNLAESIENASAATQESEKLQQKLNDMERQLQQATAATLNFQAELAAVKESQKQNEAVRNLDSEEEGMKQNMKDMEEQLRESVRNAEHYATELADSVHHSESKDAELEELHNRINDMEGQLHDAKAAAEKFRNQLMESNNYSSEESAELKELKDMVNTIKKELQASTLYNEQNEKRLADYERAMTAKNTELDLLQLELKEMRLQYSGMVNTDDLDDDEWVIPHTDGTCEKQKAASKARQTVNPQVEVLQQKIELMEQQLAQTTATSEHYEQELAISSEALQEKNSKVQELEEKVRGMEDQLQLSMKQGEKYEKQLADVTQQMGERQKFQEQQQFANENMSNMNNGSQRGAIPVEETISGKDVQALLDNAAKGMTSASTSSSSGGNAGQLRPHQVNWAVDDIIEPGNAK